MSAGGSIVGLTFDATVAWPAYDWMGVAKAGLESTSRYLARDLGPDGHPLQPGLGRPAQDPGRQGDPGLRGAGVDVEGPRPAGLGRDRPHADRQGRRARCCRTSSPRRPARSCTSTAASTRWGSERPLLGTHERSAQPTFRWTWLSADEHSPDGRLLHRVAHDPPVVDHATWVTLRWDAREAAPWRAHPVEQWRLRRHRMPRPRDWWHGVRSSARCCRLVAAGLPRPCWARHPASSGGSAIAGPGAAIDASRPPAGSTHRETRRNRLAIRGPRHRSARASTSMTRR